MRSMWKGAIQFGLVAIPVHLCLATDPGGSGANLLHRECLAQTQMKTWCPEHGEISRSDTVRGWQVAPDQWVTLTDAELESLPIRTLHTIEVEQFLGKEDLASLRRFPRQSYYLEPEPLGRRAFALMVTVLARSNAGALARITIRDREHLASIEPYRGALLLTTVAWPSEIRSVKDLDLPEAAPPGSERRLAETLVAAMRVPLDLTTHHDSYRDALETLIAAKSTGGEVIDRSDPPTPVLRDLMAALEASVAAARASTARTTAVKSSRRRRDAA